MRRQNPLPDHELMSVYFAAVFASERIRDDLIAAADHLHADATEAAHNRMMASRRDLADTDRRRRVQVDANDARKFMYEDAERRHLDRCAALAQQFGQHWTGPGNPDAPHARAFVASLDGEPTVVEHHAGIQHIRRVLNGRVVPEVFEAHTARGTFAGDMTAAKARATMTPAEVREVDN